ncbi:MAG TPA: response regulator [Thermoanaerobaculia bacterium]|nr:response regulator [Thermoanaerobaculia bacterium]
MVDDEEDVVWTFSRQMKRERPQFEFQGFLDPMEALQQIRRAPPDVLVTDMRMAQMSGLELVVEARKVAPGLPVLLITAYSTDEVRRKVLETGSIEYFEKPYEFSKLIETLDRALSRTAGFSGSLSIPMLPDLVQICALSKTTGALRIVEGGHRGMLWFAQGEIVHCECGPLAGEAAFYELLTWRRGSFTMENGETSPVRSIETSWETLLLEGCRRLDEASDDSSGLASTLDEAGADLDEATAQLRITIRRAMPKPGTMTIAVVSQETGDVTPLVGPAATTEMAKIAASVVAAAGRLTDSPTGFVESICADVGMGVVWGLEGNRALVVADTLDDRNSAALFRYQFAALVHAIEPGAARRVDGHEDR